MTFSKKLGYGLGIFGPMLGWVAAMQYLMYFYTEVVGIEPAEAGLIFLIGMVCDAVSDPLIGVVADRTRTRWGRYRPYLLFGAFPYGVCIAFLFTPPNAAPENIFILLLTAHLLFRISYTLVYMPYTAMVARLTSDYDSRTELTAFKTFFVFSANLTISFLFYTLVLQFGSGEEQQGFLPAALLIGVFATITCWLCFQLTDESKPVLSNTPARDRPPFKTILGDLIGNRPFLRVFFGVAVFGGFYGAELSMIPYVAKYWFEDASLSRTFFTTQAVMSLCSVPLWLWAGKHFEKKLVWLLGTGMPSMALLLLYVLASKSVLLAALLYGVSNVGATGFILIFYSMTADTVDWGEWKKQRRHEGAIFGAVSFSNKFAAGVATGALGAGLSWIGFVSDRAQSSETLASMILMALVVPALAFLLSALLMLNYPISRNRHQKIVKHSEQADEFKG